MRLIYVVGVPGAGKTTIVAVAAGRVVEESAKPIAHEVRESGVVTLGRTRAPFGGTDSLSMSVLPRALAWLRDEGSPDVVLAEGDRLATRKFLDPMRAKGRVTLVWVDLPAAVAAGRRAARCAEHGLAPQSEPWLRGRATKVGRLVAGWEGDLLVLDGEAPVEESARVLRETMGLDLHS